MREQIPNVLFQMLFRGANAVGYTNYPDNVIREFVKKSADAGIDVFRIFDSLNWIKGMEVAIDATREAGKVAEAAICYTGDILMIPVRNIRLVIIKKWQKSLNQQVRREVAADHSASDTVPVLVPEAAGDTSYGTGAKERSFDTLFGWRSRKNVTANMLISSVPSAAIDVITAS